MGFVFVKYIRGALGPSLSHFQTPPSLVFRTDLRSGDLYVPISELGKPVPRGGWLAKVVQLEWQGFMFKGTGPRDPYSSHFAMGCCVTL